VSSWLIAFVGLIYLAIAIYETLRGSTWLGVTFFAYALANVGLYMIARSGSAP
jgi:uncharacterized membrane protein (DUF2068 family)